MKQAFDLAIASDSEYETASIKLLEEISGELGLSTYVIKAHNLDDTCLRLEREEIGFNFYFDRASDTSPEFLNLYNLVIQRNVPVLDPWVNLKRASDKALMHIGFEDAGIPTPYTIILPPLDRLGGTCFLEADLSKVGKPFVVKPANTTGGGIGVVNGAESIRDVDQARRMYHDNKYLLQERIIPHEEKGRRFWFRCFYVCGAVECAWWDDKTHIYDILHQDEIRAYALTPLFRIVRKIAKVCGLHFFSTEIAYTEKGEFVVVDYVNEICDMRLKSQFPDGVSDEIIRRIYGEIAKHVARKVGKRRSKSDWLKWLGRQR
jgi:hypothetical protein